MSPDAGTNVNDARAPNLMSSAIRIVVTGTNGQVARSLTELAPPAGFHVTALGKDLFDLADATTHGRQIEAAEPDLIVSAAAHTDATVAESEPERANAINIHGAEKLARIAQALAIPIIHLSTAYVFDGANPAPYREDDPVAPLNVYGRSKLMGERAVMAACDRHVILRLSWMYSPFGRNVVTAMLAHAAKSDTIRVVTDQSGNPTAAADVARGVMQIARNLLRGNPRADGCGLFHMAAQGAGTPLDLARAIFAASAAHGGPSPRIMPVTSTDFSTRVSRPPNATLDSAKLAAVHGVTLPDWRASLAPCVARIVEDMARNARGGASKI
jgi:dTDP-4-dehydrorhamnose reductase